jgi:thymidylate synthase
MLCSVNIEIMRKFKVEEPIEKSRNNDEIVYNEFLLYLYNKIINNDIVATGANASQTAGQEGYVELLAKRVDLDPYAPYIYLDKNFQTPKKYVKAELDWYKSMDLSIIGHEGIESNPTWQSCCTQDDKKLVNSNYGWCVFSEENGSQYDNCLEVLKKDKTTRNAIIVYNRPEIYKDYKKDGAHDMICTMYSHFFIRKNKLYMVHQMRSNDIRYGFICSDLAWNCFVYQNMYEDLKETYPDLEVGTIRWTSDSMHLYSRHFDDLKKFVEEKQKFHNAIYSV